MPIDGLDRETTCVQNLIKLIKVFGDYDNQTRTNSIFLFTLVAHFARSSNNKTINRCIDDTILGTAGSGRQCRIQFRFHPISGKLLLSVRLLADVWRGCGGGGGWPLLSMGEAAPAATGGNPQYSLSTASVPAHTHALALRPRYVPYTLHLVIDSTMYL